MAGAFTLTSLLCMISLFKNHDYQKKSTFVFNLFYPFITFALLVLSISKIDFIITIFVAVSLSLNAIRFIVEHEKNIIYKVLYSFLIPVIFYFIKDNKAIHIYYYGALAILELNAFIQTFVCKRRAISSLIGPILTLLPFIIYDISITEELPKIKNVGYIVLVFAFFFHLKSYLRKRKRKTLSHSQKKTVAKKTTSNRSKDLSAGGAITPFIIGEILSIALFACIFAKILPYTYNNHLSLVIITFIVTSILGIVCLCRNADDMSRPFALLNGFYPLITLSMLILPKLNISITNTIFMSFSFIILSSLFALYDSYMEIGYKLFFLFHFLLTFFIPFAYKLIQQHGNSMVLRVFYFIAVAIVELFCIFNIFCQKDYDFDNTSGMLFSFGGMFVLLIAFIMFALSGFYIFLGVVGIIAGLGLGIAGICTYD